MGASGNRIGLFESRIGSTGSGATNRVNCAFPTYLPPRGKLPAYRQRAKPDANPAHLPGGKLHRARSSEHDPTR
jgi:hypothetical protein